MGLPVVSAKLILPCLAIVAFWSTLKLASDNETFALIEKTVSTRKFPDSEIPLLWQWSGIESVDDIFRLMVNIIYPLYDGKNPKNTLQAVHFFGQLVSIYVLMMVESFRVGNAWKGVSFIVLWGLGMEFVGFAIVLPILCWTHLVTSPTAKPPSSSSLSLRKTSLLIHPTELQVLPWAVVIGHFVPVALTFYFPPDTLQPIWQSQQFWLIGRLFHPVFTSIVQLLLSIFAVDSRGSDYASAARRNRDVLRQLQSVYTFATSCAILLHLGTLSLAVSSQLFPSVFTERYRAAFDPTAVWIPVPFWDKSAVATVPTGTLYLLQWDEICACATALVWAIALNREGLSDQEGRSSFLSMMLRVLLMTTVGGPAAATISLIQERDRLLLDKIDASEEKKTS